MESAQKFAVVLLDKGVEKGLDYKVPNELEAAVFIGSRVKVPVRGGFSLGTVIEIKGSSPFQTVRPIHTLLSKEALITPALFKLALWISRYWATPLSKVLKTMIPASVRKATQKKLQYFVERKKSREEIREHLIKIRGKQQGQESILDVMLQVEKGLFLSELLEEAETSKSPVDTLVKQGFLSIRGVEHDRSPFHNDEYFLTRKKALNEEQESAFIKIAYDLEKGHFKTHLLHGVTGSGKTEIFLQAIDRALELGKGAIYLVPQVSLTPQTIERLRSRFSEHIAILHHSLSDGERRDTWHNIAQGKFKIVVGARSAIFSPIVNLGLIIVDEEHEDSYKQDEEAPCYHARDLAVLRGSLENLTVVLASATPSLESYTNALSGKYELSTLVGRAGAQNLPSVHIVDMRREYEKRKGFTPFSDLLLQKIEERLQKHEQTILFLNRRGYHTSLSCKACGEGIKCRHCDVYMTFHKEGAFLECHTCGFKLVPLPTTCPSCKKGAVLAFRGMGSELVEKALHALFPTIRTLRMDRDTTSHKGSHQKIYKAFATGKADVLIGTQMIAKGLHFPEVTLVGVIGADQELQFPDFRASEHTFQLITQVAGRAGRGAGSGEVILQTTIPDNSTLVHAKNQDYLAFYNEEMEVRRAFGYPPAAKLVKVSFSGLDEGEVVSFSTKWREQAVSVCPEDAEILPLVPRGKRKIKDNFRYHFIIRAGCALSVADALAKGGLPPQTKKVRVLVDVNPNNTFF